MVHWWSSNASFHLKRNLSWLTPSTQCCRRLLNPGRTELFLLNELGRMFQFLFYYQIRALVKCSHLCCFINFPEDDWSWWYMVSLYFCGNNFKNSVTWTSQSFIMIIDYVFRAWLGSAGSQEVSRNSAVGYLQLKMSSTFLPILSTMNIMHTVLSLYGSRNIPRKQEQSLWQFFEGSVSTCSVGGVLEKGGSWRCWWGKNLCLIITILLLRRSHLRK